MRTWCAALFAVWACVVRGRPSSCLEMVVLHAADMHSRFEETDGRGNECLGRGARCYGGIARMAGAVAAQRRAAEARGLPSLFVVAGDSYQGTAYYSFFKWKPVAEFVGALAPNVTTLGNHEFDDGPEGLVPYLKATAHLAPVVTANVIMNSEEGKKLVLSSWTVTLTDAAGRTGTVGVVGYVTKNSEFTSSPGGIKFSDEIVSLKKEINNLKNKGVNIIIGLGHSGIEVDKTIAAEVDGIDLIVGGHSHTFLYTGKPPDTDKPVGSYPTWVITASGKRIPILHAAAFTKYLGKVYLRFSDNGHLEEINGNPILLDSSVPQDSSISQLVDKWKAKLTNVSCFTFVGEITEDLVNDCHMVQCDIGNIVADSFVYYNVLAENKREEQWTNAPIAVVQAGTIRASIDVGPNGGKISLGQLITATPFMNTLVKVTISGKNLLEAFENSVRNYNKTKGTGLFLQVSGAIVEYDLSSDPGNRVVSLNLRCKQYRISKFKPVDLDAYYTVLMSDYLARGGDHYTSFKREVVDHKSLHVNTYTATVVYMKATSPMRNEPKGSRIRFVNRTDDKNATTTATMHLDKSMQLLKAIANLRARSSTAASPLEKKFIISIVIVLVLFL